MILGVDLSHWQLLSGFDWMMASRQGNRFAIVKLSQGFGVSDRGRQHLERLLAANAEIVQTGLDPIAVGVYHFADPLRNGLQVFDPEGQAEVFCDAMLAAGWPWAHALIPWLDMEWKSFGKTAAGKARGARFRRQFASDEVLLWTRRFCGTVADRLGVMPGIYTGRSYVKYRYKSTPDLRLYEGWLAGYVPVGPERDHVPGPLERPLPVALNEGHRWSPVIWQWTGRGSVPWYRGGKGRIDRNMLLGSEADFGRLKVDGTW